MSAFLALIAGIAACSGMSGTLIAAHRGGMESGAPENTLPAFQQALQQGAHLIELDLRATADGAVVVHHDRNTARTTGRSGMIHRLTLDDVRTFRPGGQAFIPTLEEVVRWAEHHPVGLLLDVKPAPGLTASAIVEPVRSAGLSQRVLLGVRSAEEIRAFRRHGDDLRILGFVPSPETIDDFVAAGAEAIRLWPRWLDDRPELVAELQHRGVGTWVTTGDADANRLAALVRLGIEGVITDRPAMARRAIGCRSHGDGAEGS